MYCTHALYSATHSSVKQPRPQCMTTSLPRFDLDMSSYSAGGQQSLTFFHNYKGSNYKLINRSQ